MVVEVVFAGRVDAIAGRVLCHVSMLAFSCNETRETNPATDTWTATSTSNAPSLMIRPGVMAHLRGRLRENVDLAIKDDKPGSDWLIRTAGWVKAA